jgi:hypothetical protein
VSPSHPLTLVVLFRHGRELGSWPLPRTQRAPDLDDVAAVARLHIVARRAGASMLLRDADPGLLELLDFVGLSGLTIEVGRESEHLEQPGVEEVVVPDDPVA